MIRLLDLEIFVDLERSKSFSKTGKRLGMTQSSITQVIQKLENRLGARLINRSSKSFTLTPAGRIFITTAKDIISSFKLCEEQIRQLDEEERRKIRVAVSTTPGEFILPSFFSDFSQRYSDIRLVIEMADSRRAIEMILDHECQVAVVGCIMKELDRDYETIPLLQENLVIITSPNVNAHDGTITIDQVSKMTRIDRESGSGTQSEASTYLQRIISMIRKKNPQFEPNTLQLQSVQAILSAVSSGKDLYAMVGYYPAKKYADSGLVTIAEIDGLTLNATRAIHLVFNKKERTDILSLFIENLKKYCEMQDIFNAFTEE